MQDFKWLKSNRKIGFHAFHNKDNKEFLELSPFVLNLNKIKVLIAHSIYETNK